jgi:hypothetical protein
MRILDPAAREILRHPGTFIWRTCAPFRANQGLLLAARWRTTRCSRSCRC